MAEGVTKVCEVKLSDLKCGKTMDSLEVGGDGGCTEMEEGLIAYIQR